MPNSLDDLQADFAVRARSIAKYRRRAFAYDASCGTGLSLELLRGGVGASGVVHGFDQSPDMLERARARVAAAGWTNVHLHQACAQQVRLGEPVDALLFHYTHDILRSGAALERLLGLARPGATVAIAGIKYFGGWLRVLNGWVYLKNAGYNGAPGELSSPWDRIAPRLEDWRFAQTQFGMGYLASGRVAGA